MAALKCICPGKHGVCVGAASTGCRYKLRPQSVEESRKEVEFCLKLYPELRIKEGGEHT